MQKISKHKTAMTYANAWLEAAIEQKQEDVVFEEVGVLGSSLKTQVDIWQILAQPVDDNLQKMQVIKAFSKDVKLSKVSTETLKLIIENDRLNLLGLILHSYKEAYYKYKGIIAVTVDSAVALTETQDKKLKKVLEDKLKAPIVIDYHIKPEVLGGLAIRYNSFLIDDTLAGKLKHIKKIIAHPQTG